MTARSFFLNRWYEQRPLRERVILLVCALLVLALLMNYFVFEAFGRERRLLTRELAVLESEAAGLQARKENVLARKERDPDRDNKQRLKALQQKSFQLQQQLGAGIVNLVAPREMPDLLKDLLTRQKRLRLISLQNLPPEPLTFDHGGEESAPPVLYLHPLKLEFSGDYLTLLKYLNQLEHLPKSIVWDSVEIETETYPEAIVRIQVHTLSLTEGWIGG